VFTIPNISEYAQDWGFIGASPWRHSGFTFLTPVFLHVSWVHLLVNLYFLLLFGKDVESALGCWKYGLLLLCAQLSCCFLLGVFAMGQTIPAVGASGLVWGVLTYYCLKYPRRRFGIMWVRGWASFPAPLFFALWGALELLGSIVQADSANVDRGYLGHLGGILAGFFFFLSFRREKTN